MGQFPSAMTPFRNNFGLVRYRTIQTKYTNLTAVKIHPEGNLIAVANEQGSLALFDLASKSDLPAQNRQLHYKYGGVSDLLWLTTELLAVGTTRGQVVIFDLDNMHNILKEVCVVNAHGDGVAQVAVQAMDFSAKDHMLVTVAQGIHCIRFWQVGDGGKLSPRDIASPVMYLEPRFVAFTQTGILVGYFENILLQNYTLDLVLVEERPLGQTDGRVNEDRQMANAMLLEEADTLAILNLSDGIETFEPSKLIPKGKGIFKASPYCSQGISSLRQGAYLVSSAANGFINIHKSADMTEVERYRMSRNEIQALHSLNHPKFGEDLVVSLSCKNGKPSDLAVWGHRTGLKRHKLGDEKLPLTNANSADYSTLRIISLCISVYTLCHIVNIFLIPILAQTSAHGTIPGIHSTHSLGLSRQGAVFVFPSSDAQTWGSVDPTATTAATTASPASFLTPATSTTAPAAASIGSCIPRSAEHALNVGHPGY